MNLEVWLWIAFAVALGLELLNSAANSAFNHARLPYLISLREKEPGRVDKTIALMEQPGLHTALRIGLTLTHFLTAGILAYNLIIVEALGSDWVRVGIWLFALLLILIVEFMIERNILASPEEATVNLTGMAGMIATLLSPLSKFMLNILGEHAEKMKLSVTDDVLRDWVEVGEPESNLEKGEREMIYSIFRFGETLAKDVMVPRIDVLALDINTTISEARQEFIKAGHSRVPVYEDTIDNVVGLLYAKDLLSVVDGNDTIAQQRRLLRPAYFIPETKKVDELLTEMQSRGVHMAVVVDEYGGVAGVVTLEDIMEEIVGEIRDEYDQSEEQIVEKISDDEYLFLGRATIDEVNEITGLHLSKEHADTLGGLIYSRLGRVPQPGEVVYESGAELTVEKVVARRILKVRVHLLPAGELTQEIEADNANIR